MNLSELMVGGFGVSDPVTSGGETREGSASDSDSLLNGEDRLKVCVGCRLKERHRLSIPTAFPSRSHEKIVRLWGLCEGIYTLSVHIGGTDAVSSVPSHKLPLSNDCI
jgi:hypothetical protein